MIAKYTDTRRGNTFVWMVHTF